MGTTDRTLDKGQWVPFFADLTKEIEGAGATIEVAGIDVGDQVMGERISLEGLSYDPKDDAFWVHTEPLDHQIMHPTAIYVTESDGKLIGIGIRDGEGRLQMVKLTVPLEREVAQREARMRREAETSPPP